MPTDTTINPLAFEARNGGGQTCQPFRTIQRTNPSPTSVHRTSVVSSTESCTVGSNERERYGENSCSEITLATTHVETAIEPSGEAER